MAEIICLAVIVISMAVAILGSKGITTQDVLRIRYRSNEFKGE